jgi:Protein of unknown function (DUF2530)
MLTIPPAGSLGRVVKVSSRDDALPEYSEFKPVAVGIAIWALLLVGGVVFRDDLTAAGHHWWIWVAVAGVVEGGLGYAYLLRRAARRPPDTDSPEPPSPPGPPGPPTPRTAPTPDSRTPDRS